MAAPHRSSRTTADSKFRNEVVIAREPAASLPDFEWLFDDESELREFAK